MTCRICGVTPDDPDSHVCGITHIAHEQIRELEDNGDCGYVMGWHLKGHYDLATVEEFLLWQVDEGYRFAHLDVTETWCRKVPTEFGCRYAYTDQPGRGAYPVTRIERAWIPASVEAAAS